MLLLSYSAAWNFLFICRGQNADSICGLNAVKPRLPQRKAAVSPRLIGSLSNHDDDGSKNPTYLQLCLSCVDDVSIWWQIFNFVFLCVKCWFRFNSRIVRTHFSSVMTLNNWKMIAETRSYIFSTDSSVGWASGCYAGGRVFNTGGTNTQGLKITE